LEKPLRLARVDPHVVTFPQTSVELDFYYNLDETHVFIWYKHEKNVYSSVGVSVGTEVEEALKITFISNLNLDFSTLSFCRQMLRLSKFKLKRHHVLK